MYILDYDEFNIYTTSSDVENYIESLIEQGVSIKEEIYERCIGYFGTELKHLVDEIFSDEDEN
jgi:hypothetical protein